MLTEFFLVSGYVFWIIVAGIVLLDIALLSWADPDDTGWAVFFTAAGLVGAVLFTDAFKGIYVQTLIAGAVLYLIFGVIWSFYKWFDFVIEAKRTRSKDEKPPLAARNKQRITTWMALWPFSLMWWILTWPRRAFIWLYERISTVFDRISERIWAS